VHMFRRELLVLTLHAQHQAPQLMSRRMVPVLPVRAGVVDDEPLPSVTGLHDLDQRRAEQRAPVRLEQPPAEGLHGQQLIYYNARYGPC